MHAQGSTMYLKHFRDFYFLEALQAKMSMAMISNPANGFRKSFLVLKDDIDSAFETLTDRMALHIYAYLWHAALGEATFAKDTCEEYDAEELENFHDGFFLEYPPTIESNVELIKNIYAQSWGLRYGTYGGQSWLQIVEGMDLYGKISNAAFIDHAVDLEHNGGCVFDKTGSMSKVKMACYGDEFHSGYLKNFLDLKFSSDILNEKSEGWREYNGISRKVYNLILRFSNIVEKVEAVEFLFEDFDFLGEYEIEWGDGELTECTPSGGLRCEECNTKIDPDDHMHNTNEDCICQSCYDNSYTYCNECGHTVENENYVNDADMCARCAKENGWFQCDDCEKWHDESDWNDVEGSSYCPKCAKEHGDFCHDCGEWFVDIETHNKQNHEREE